MAHTAMEDGRGIAHRVHDCTATNGQRVRVTVNGFVRQNFQQVGNQFRVVFTGFSALQNHCLAHEFDVFSMGLEIGLDLTQQMRQR